jgi:hypothetical protein
MTYLALVSVVVSGNLLVKCTRRSLVLQLRWIEGQRQSSNTNQYARSLVLFLHLGWVCLRHGSGMAWLFRMMS